MSLLELRHVSRRFGPVTALDDVSLVLQPGTIGLVGNNGAGKSTLLKILLGLLRPDQGQGTVLGHDLVHSGKELRGRVGYMPEAAALVPVLQGVEFVTLSGDLYGMPHGEARRRAHEVLGYVGLGELRYRRLEEYSTGNLQRLKLAAALVHDPQLLLLDEPTGGLDPQGRRGMLRLLEDLIRETGKSVLLCTHLLGDIEQLCRQVVLLHQGRVMYCGDYQTLRTRTSGRYVVQAAAAGQARSLAEVLTAAGWRPDLLAAGRLAVPLPPGRTTADLLGLAYRAGLTLHELAPEEEDLAAVFRRLTARENGGEHPAANSPREVPHAG